jgi:hypothetical protein
LTRFGNDDAGQLGDLDLTDEVEIVGPAATMTIITAQPLGTASVEPVISILGADVVLRGLTITRSQVEGVRMQAGSLLMERCEVVNNDIQGNSAGVRSGGDALLVIRDSAIINNGMGVLAVGGDVEMENVTLHSNATQQIFMDGSVLFICKHCTVVADQLGGNAEVHIGASFAIFENSVVYGVCERVSGGLIASDGGNLESPGSTCLFNLLTDRDDVADLGLSALANHGGETRTFELLAGSPALALVEAEDCSAHDQRGVGRGFQLETCDSGAVERTTERVPTPLFADGFEQGDTEAWSLEVP